MSVIILGEAFENVDPNNEAGLISAIRVIFG